MVRLKKAIAFLVTSAMLVSYVPATVMAAGWEKSGDSWVYVLSNGEHATGWKQISKKWYYFDEEGLMVTGIVNIDGSDYFFDANGVMKTGWQKDGSSYRYFSKSGSAVVKDWVKVSGVWYYLDADGIMVTGIQEIDGKLYYFKSSGALGSGWQQNADKSSYFYFTTSGAVKGWKQISKVWYYFDSSTYLMATGPTKIDGRLYLFASSGAMQKSGWKKDAEGNDYYLSSSGAAVNNEWKKSGSKWYYLGEDCIMVKGLKVIGSDTYYFDDTGAMVTNKDIDGRHFGADGKMTVDSNNPSVTSQIWYLSSKPNGVYNFAKKLNLDITVTPSVKMYFTVSKGSSVLYTSPVTSKDNSLSMYFSSEQNAPMTGDYITPGSYTFSVYTEGGNKFFSAVATVTQDGTPEPEPGSGNEPIEDEGISIWWYLDDESAYNGDTVYNKKSFEFTGYLDKDAKIYYVISKDGTQIYKSATYTTEKETVEATMSSENLSATLFDSDGYLLSGKYTVAIYKSNKTLLGQSTVEIIRGVEPIYNDDIKILDKENVMEVYFDEYESTFYRDDTNIILNGGMWRTYTNGLYAAIYYCPDEVLDTSKTPVKSMTVKKYTTHTDDYESDTCYTYVFNFDKTDYEPGVYYICVATSKSKVGSPLFTAKCTVKDNTSPYNFDPSEYSTPGDKLSVMSWNEEFMRYMAQYSDVDAYYTMVESTGGAYRVALDMMLASGDNCPDVFMLEADYIDKFMNNNAVMPISELGIKDSELSQMFQYTKDIGSSSSGVLKALTYTAYPSGVFYNRKVTQKYLGVSSPDDVAPYFSSWSNFTKAAQTINNKSDGKVKIIASMQDVSRPYLAGRSKGWIVNGKANVDPVAEDYLNFAKNLFDSDLTWNASQWSDTAWCDGSINGTVASYFGPMWLGRYSLGISDEDGASVKDTWGFVKAPTASYWGGTWVAVSKYTTRKAEAAQLLRDICIDTDNLTTMAAKGDFVNNKAVMNSCKTSSDWTFGFLGGQNPVSTMIEIANDIKPVTDGDYLASSCFIDISCRYTEGEIATVADAKSQFVAMLKELGLTN